jgi:hypothetical protein
MTPGRLLLFGLEQSENLDGIWPKVGFPNETGRLKPDSAAG